MIRADTTKFQQGNDLSNTQGLRKRFSTETWIITPDKHFAHSSQGLKPMDRHDSTALSVLLQVMKDIKPDHYIDLGDTAHLSYLSHWNVEKDMQGRSVSENGETISMSLKDDHALINVWWDKVQEACKRDTKYYFEEGNHEEILRVMRNMRKYDGLDKAQFFVEKQWFFDQRKIKFIPYQNHGTDGDNWVQVGPHLRVMHGNYASKNHLTKHWEDHQTNVIYGHMHVRETKDFKHPRSAVTVQTIGCLCGKRASYHRGRHNAWSQGFSVVHLYPDGRFLDEFVRILDGRCYYGGKTYFAKPERWME